jgi:hypothetical protein
MAVRKASEMAVVKHPLVVFVLTSILMSWAFWSPIIGSHVGLLPQDIEITSIGGFILYLVAMTSMWIAALPLIVAHQGIEGVKNAYRNLFNRRNSALWYAVAIILPLTVEIVPPALYASLSGNPAFSAFSLPYVLFVLALGVHMALVLALGGTGYALQLFAEGRGRFAATLVTSAYTLVWIAPMYLEVIARHPGYPALWYVLGYIPAALMVTWLYHSVELA